MKNGYLIDTILHRDTQHEDVHELSAYAREHIRHNAVTFVAANGMQNIADQLAKASTVLPWVMSAVGAPAWMTGLLVPIRESGSMLPQAALQPWVRAHRRRAAIWVAGAFGQALGAALIALAAALLQGWAAGVVVLLGLVTQALARSLNSIASKDIQGRTSPKGLRGRVSGLATTISGIVAITVGLAIRIWGGSDLSRAVLAALVGVAALAFALGGVIFARIKEDDGAAGGRTRSGTAGAQPGNGTASAEIGNQAHSAAAGAPVRLRDTLLHLGWLKETWQLLTADAPFRRFVIVRSLLLVSALTPPFIVAHAAQESGAGMSSVATFIVASGVAALLGGRISGVVSDKSSRKTIIYGAALASMLVLVYVAASFLPALIRQWWWGPAAFFLLTLVHTGVRVGRKTYVVDMAEGDKRTQYVAVANTAMGVILLLTGALTSALAAFGPVVALIFLAGLGLLGVAVGRTLEEVSVGA